MLPNFLVIGAAKCGTTSVCHALGRHPDVFMTEPKEIHYFGQIDPAKSREWYESFFAGATETARGEGSTSYTHPLKIGRCARSIAETVPDCRLIYMVRHPIDRLESDWKMRWREGWADDSINEAVRTQDSLIAHGLYWTNLNTYLRWFSEEQILIVFLEDFANDPNTELKRCFRHIGVDPDCDITAPSRAINSGAEKRADRLLARVLRRTPAFQTLKDKTPQRHRQWLKRCLTKQHTPPPVAWDPRARALAAKYLRDDAERLLRYCKKPLDFWDLDDGGAGPKPRKKADKPKGLRTAGEVPN